MSISKNAMLNLILAKQNDTMSEHTNNILLSSMGGMMSLVGSKKLYESIDETVKEKDAEISRLNAELEPFENIIKDPKLNTPDFKKKVVDIIINGQYIYYQRLYNSLAGITEKKIDDNYTKDNAYDDMVNSIEGVTKSLEANNA